MVSSKSSFFALSGGQNTFLPHEITGRRHLQCSRRWPLLGQSHCRRCPHVQPPAKPSLGTLRHSRLHQGHQGGRWHLPDHHRDPAGYLIDGAAVNSSSTPLTLPLPLCSMGYGWSQVA
jgi:hypothetical protein